MITSETSIVSIIGRITKESLFKPEEIIHHPSSGAVDTIEPDVMVKVAAIRNGFGFHKHRLEKNRQEIKNILNMMPNKFHKDTGGGWSFLNLCMDKNDSLWGEHQHCEQLYALAAGLGMAKFTMPREMWDMFPGSMPYIVFDTEGGL